MIETIYLDQVLASLSNYNYKDLHIVIIFFVVVFYIFFVIYQAVSFFLSMIEATYVYFIFFCFQIIQCSSGCHSQCCTLHIYNIPRWRHDMESISPYFWPYVSGICRSPLEPLHKRLVMQSIDISLIVRMDKLLSACDAVEMHLKYINIPIVAFARSTIMNTSHAIKCKSKWMDMEKKASRLVMPQWSTHGCAPAGQNTDKKSMDGDCRICNVHEM